MRTPIEAPLIRMFLPVRLMVRYSLLCLSLACSKQYQKHSYDAEVRMGASCKVKRRRQEAIGGHCPEVRLLRSLGPSTT